MSDRPIIFSGPMVRAILDGRKTQTRRVLKPQPEWKPEDRTPGGFTIAAGWAWRDLEAWPNPETFAAAVVKRVPYAPGDRLWVREAFQMGWPLGYDDTPDQYDENGGENPMTVWYRATGDINRWVDEDGNHQDVPWRSPIHMPRWASRLTLTVTDVRVQRLQEISEADAVAEGGPPSHPSIDRVSREFGYPDYSRSWFAQTWNSIHGPGAWDANPWVVALTFTVERRNIDARDDG